MFRVYTLFDPIRSLRKKTVLFSFRFREKTYVVQQCDGEGADAVVTPIRWSFLHGFVHTDEAVSPEAMDIGYRILAYHQSNSDLRAVNPCHYTAMVYQAEGQMRLRVRRTKGSLFTAYRRVVPAVLRVTVAVMVAIAAYCIWGDSAYGWLSFLLPRWSEARLEDTIRILTATGTLGLGAYALLRHDIVAVGIHAVIPLGAVILVGVCRRRLWVMPLLVLTAVLVGLLLYRLYQLQGGLPYQQRRRGAWTRFGSDVLALTVAVSLLVTSAAGVTPYTFGDPVDHPREMCEEELNERYSKACRSLAQDTFPTLSVPKRVAVLQAICDYECYYELGCAPPTVRAGAIREENTCGNYRDADQVITIDLTHITQGDTDDIVNTLLHETRHHWQQRISALYYAVEPHLSEEFYGMSPFKEARYFHENMQNYISSEENMAAYYEQILEVDSRNWASSRMWQCYTYYTKK